MINPGALPVADATFDTAAENFRVFLAEFGARGGRLDGEPRRDEPADEDGRYGWLLPLAGGGTVRVLIPGVPLEQLKRLDAAAPCLRIGATWWWWNDAVGQAIPVEPGRFEG